MEHPVFVNHQIQNTGKTKVSSLQETIRQAKLSLCIIYMQLGHAWLDAPVRAEPGK